MFIKHRDECSIFVAGPCSAALRIKQPAIPAPAEATSGACNPISSRLRGAGDAKNGSGNLAVDVGCRGVAFEPDHPVTTKLKITADLPASKETTCVAGSGDAGCESRSGHFLLAPAPTQMPTDVAPRPAKYGSGSCNGR